VVREQDILNCTPEDSPQAQELHDLLQAVQEVNTHVNESKRKQDNTQKLLLIQKGNERSPRVARTARLCRGVPLTIPFDPSTSGLVGHNDLSIFDRIGRRFIMEGHMGARLVYGT
jgi:hypothetical protein